jgi:hypothetical protein
MTGAAKNLTQHVQIAAAKFGLMNEVTLHTKPAVL